MKKSVTNKISPISELLPEILQNLFIYNFILNNNRNTKNYKTDLKDIHNIDNDILVDYYDIGEIIKQEMVNQCNWYAKLSLINKGWNEIINNISCNFSNYKLCKNMKSKIYFFFAMYYNKNAEKFIEYLEMACNLENMEANFYMGKLLFLNKFILIQPYLRSESNINNNRERGIKLITKAADDGNKAAMCVLGNIYQYTKIPGLKDVKKAIEYYKKGIEFNCGMCYHSLGIIYENGIYSERDIKLAGTYYNKAIEYGDYSAHTSIAMFYNDQKPISNIDNNYKLVFDHYKKASEYNDLYALFNLGTYYEYGINPVNKSLLTAYKYFKKASILGDLDSHNKCLTYQENGWV
jgi:TPR repeat protein